MKLILYYEKGEMSIDVSIFISCFHFLLEELNGGSALVWPVTRQGFILKLSFLILICPFKFQLHLYLLQIGYVSPYYH